VDVQAPFMTKLDTRYGGHFHPRPFMSWINKPYESRSREISYMKYANGRRTGLVTFCLQTAFYNGLLKERYKGG